MLCDGFCAFVVFSICFCAGEPFGTPFPARFVVGGTFYEDAVCYVNFYNYFCSLNCKSI